MKFRKGDLYKMKRDEEQELFLKLRDEEKELYKDFFFKANDDFTMWRDGEETYSKDESVLGRDWIYIYQDKKAFEVLVYLRNSSNQELKILDVGSKFYAALFFSAIGETRYLEPRIEDIFGGEWPFFRQLNMGFIKGEAQDIPVSDKSFNAVTCLHAMEHFGLGRYGDTIDYYGDQKGLREFNRVLDDSGHLILSVPVNENARIDFNEQRVYNPDMIDEMLDRAGFEVESRFYIVSLGHLRGPEGQVFEPTSSSREVLRGVKESDHAAYMTLSTKR